MSVVVSLSDVPALTIAIARPESALPTIYIIGKLDSALAPSPIVRVGFLWPLRVQPCSVGPLKEVF